MFLGQCRSKLVPQAAGQYYIQPFMVGLTMQALIRYWDVTHDPRVQPAVQKALDWLWTRAWVAKDRAFWYENWAADGNQTFPPDLCGRRHEGVPQQREAVQPELHVELRLREVAVAVAGRNPRTLVPRTRPLS